MAQTTRARPFRIRPGRIAFTLGLTFLLFFLLFPLVVLIAVSFNPVSMVFPPEGFTLHWYGVILEKPDFLRAAWASTVVGALTAVLSTSLGVLAALGITRMRGRWRDFLSAILLSPLLIPAVIVALALFQIVFILGLSNNLPVLVAAHVVVTLPYPVRNVLAQLENFDHRLEEAAMTVGATRIQSIWLVTLPMLRASIVPSFIITFVLSWNNYTISLFLASRHWTTLPLQLRAYLQYEYEPFVAAMSTVLILASGLLLFIVDRTVGLGAAKERQ